MSEESSQGILPVGLGRHGPMVLVGLGHGATHWIAATFYIVLPFMRDDLGLSYAEAGTLAAIFHAASVTANFGSGPLVDMTGRRVLFQVLSLAVGAAALLAFGTGGGFGWLAAMIVLIGATNNLWHPAAIAYLSSRYPKNRGYALSIHALGANLGDAVAPMAAGSLLVWLAWPSVAAINALPVFAVAALLGLFLSSPRSGGGKPKGVRGGDYVGGILSVVRDRAVLGLCLMAGFRTMAQNGLLVFLPLYLTDVLGTGPAAMGVALMAMQLGGIVASPIAGSLSDRIGRRPIVMAGLGVTTLVIAGSTFLGGGPLYVAGVALLGFSLYAVRPVVHSWMMDLTPPQLGGSATSLMFGTQAALSTAAPILGGVVAGLWGLPAVFYMLAAIMLVANLVAVMLPRAEPAPRG